MISKINSKIDVFLRFLLLSFPILIILGPFLLNCFSIIFSLYAVINYKNLKKFKIFDKKILIIFFSFIFFIFPFDSLNFENSFLKYLSFLRFILMLFGLIIFFEKEHNKNNIFTKIYKSYIIIFLIIIVDVLKEYFFGSNLLGFSSDYEGRIASFTNDELIIGYIFSFLILFTLIFIYKKTNHYNFFIIMIFLIIISFFIGERSNFIKSALLILTFTFVHFFYLKVFKIKNLFLITSFIFILSISFFEMTKNTYVGKRFYYSFDNNIKEEFYSTKHAAHYITAYKIFLNYPIFGIGINNFALESSKKKYENKKFNPSSTHPHQIYLEIISEVGLIGLIYFIFVFFYPIFISLKSIIRHNEINVISHLLLHLFFIFPILPSGSFFGTNYGIPFWFNLSILIYLSKKN